MWAGRISLCIPLLLSLAAFVDPPKMTSLSKDVKPFQYVAAKVPYYPAGAKWGTTAKGLMKMQLPVQPMESMKHMVWPVDFELKLFAAEPHIKRPICMNW